MPLHRHIGPPIRWTWRPRLPSPAPRPPRPALGLVTRARVYPLPEAAEGAAIRTFRAAGQLRPFPWRDQAEAAPGLRAVVEEIEERTRP